MSVARVTEIKASSKKSFDDAVKNGIKRLKMSKVRGLQSRMSKWTMVAS